MSERSILDQVRAESYMEGVRTINQVAVDEAHELGRLETYGDYEKLVRCWGAVGFLAGITVATFVNWLVM